MVQKGTFSSIFLLASIDVVELELQHPWREIESWSFRCGYIPNLNWQGTR